MFLFLNFVCDGVKFFTKKIFAQLCEIDFINNAEYSSFIVLGDIYCKGLLLSG